MCNLLYKIGYIISLKNSGKKLKISYYWNYLNEKQFKAMNF